MASTSSNLGHSQSKESSLSELIHDSPQEMLVVEPNNRFWLVATWLFGYLKYTCVVLGYLGTCLPSLQDFVIQPQGEDDTISDNAMNLESSAHNLDGDHTLEAKHKIFLSHSGAQKDFVEQLCVDLERCDRYPFFDKRRSSLPIGEKFPKLIFDAIDQCQVGVVILSKEFFMRSKWPMLELNAMVKVMKRPNSSIRIIPIFYDISIDDFKDSRHQKQWILQWEKWCAKDKRINVEEWKEALKVLNSINGMEKGCGDVKFRKEIVLEVNGLVPCETRWDDSYVQGRLHSCKIIRDKMDQVLTSSRVGFVGLYGMGGIGKTTISKALCNDLAHTFGDNVCHIELGSGSDVELLRKALKKLSDIRHDVLDQMDDIEQGHAYLKKRLHTQSIFIALDNVQYDYESLNIAQTFMKGGYGCGSVVLVIARSMDVLKRLNLEERNCLEMPELEENDARSLFLYYANISPNHEVDEVVLRSCMKRCHYLKSDGKSRHYHPLAMKVLGQHLGCNASGWAAQLCNIDPFNESKDAKHPVFSILRNSFESLDHEHRLVFMDLALLMTATYKNLLPTFSMRLEWLAMVHEESIKDIRGKLEVLKRKSLVEDLCDNFFEVGIHDLWIEFAMEETKAQVSSDQGWVYHVDEKTRMLQKSGGWKENVERMCFLNQGWKALKGLNLDDFVNVEAFKLNIEILVQDCVVDIDLSGLNRLKSLELDAPGLAIRVDGLESLANLRYLWLDISPQFPPCLDGIGCLTNLQYLGIWNCKNVKVLDLIELKLLQVIKIGHASKLMVVKGLSFKMATLQYLQIVSCNSLRECAGVGELYALEKLELDGCGKLEELPCLGQLRKLRELDIHNCESIKAVLGLSNLVALEKLLARGCCKLVVLPDLARLTKLQHLDIGKCPMQEVLGLDGLLALKYLEASFKNLLGEHPDVSKLSSLKEAWIKGWNAPQLMSIQSVFMLEELFLLNCEGEDVLDLQKLYKLRTLGIHSCGFKDLLGLSNSTALRCLSLTECYKLERLPDFEKRTNLTSLSIVRCNNLRHESSWGSLCSLRSLWVDGCSLKRVGRELAMFASLRGLALYGSGCENVLSMASLMSQLEYLIISSCLKMEAFDISGFSQLQELTLECCSALERVTCNTPLTNLTVLTVIGCESLVEMPDLSLFPKLERLQLEDCRLLPQLRCNEQLTSMKNLKLIECGGQVEVPDLSRFPNLRDFVVREALPSSDDAVDDSGDEDEIDNSGDDDEADDNTDENENDDEDVFQAKEDMAGSLA